MPFIGSVIGFIGSAIGAVGSFIGGLGLFGQALIGIGLNVASTLIQRAMQKKPEEPSRGVQFERKYGEDNPRQVACGLVGIAGHDCYVNTFGESNKFLQQVYVVSDYYTSGLSRVAINGEWVTLGAIADPDKGFPVTSGDLSGYVWVKFFDGTQAVADTYLIANANPASRWSADHIGVGMSWVLVSMTFDREHNNNFPEFFFEIKGAPLYDWRKDSTVGGNGSHRLNDPTTHEYSANPIVIEYNYRIGFSINDDLFCGMDMDVADLPLDKWTVAANICDETVDGEFRYQCSIFLNCMANHKKNIEGISLSCGSMVVDSVDGSWPLVGSAQPVVATITDGDFIATTPIKYRAKQSMQTLVNSVSGNYPNPEQLWSLVGYDPQISEEYITIDRRTRDLNVDFQQVPSGRQAAQLASIYLAENRYEITASGTLRPRWQVLEIGDWVEWQSARYGTHTFIVTASALVSLDAEGPRNNEIGLRQRDGSIDDSVTPPIIVLPTPPGAPVYLNEVQDFTAIPISVAGDDGKEFPGIRAGWSAINDVTVTGVMLRYFPTNDPTNILYETIDDPKITVAYLAKGIVANTEYSVQSRLITNPPRVTNWGAGETVTTLDVGPAFYPIEIDDLSETVSNWQKFMANAQRELRARMEDLDTIINQQVLGNAYDRASIRNQLSATYGTAKAEWTQQINVVATANIALTTRFETLESKVNNPTTGLTATANALSAFQTYANNIFATSQALTELSAEIENDVISNITLRGAVEASPGEGIARWGVQVRVDASTWSGSVGMYLDVNSTTGERGVTFDTNSFKITDGVNDVSPFMFVNGIAYMQGARIGTVVFDQLSSANGKLLIIGNGSNASIEVWS